MIKWLDIVDQEELQTLVSTYNLQLTNSTRQFLESFAHLVNKASTTRRKLITAAVARKTHVHSVNSIIAIEVSDLQQQFPQAQIIPYRHPETSLPIIYARLQAVPDLVVHVFRSYANTRRGLAFGFRAYSFCRGHLTGPLARAANYLRARCTANSWNLSLSELISLWCQQVDAIPIPERRLPPRTNKPCKMFRRRRQQKSPPTPPLAPENNEHASLPHHHPKTDVVIKDDKLFPNRTFTDPEELYAEQVRAIRKKRKPVPGVLDDYELAWKRRRPQLDNPASERPQPNLESEPQPEPHPAPLPHPPAPLRRSLFPFDTSADSPREAETPHPKQPESPEEPGISFLNPLSPELKDSALGESPSPPAETQMEKPPVAEQDAAKMEAAERAVMSKPAPSKNTPASQPPPADNPDCIPDDASAPLFFFSTAMDAHVSPVADSAPATDAAAEKEVRAEGIEEATVTPSSPEEPVREDKLTVDPMGMQKAERVTPPQTVSQRQLEGGPRVAPEEEATNSGQTDNDDIAQPSVSRVERVDVQDEKRTTLIADVSQPPRASTNDADVPLATGEAFTNGDREIDTDPNGPKDASVQESEHRKELLRSESINETVEKADSSDTRPKQGTGVVGMEPTASTDGEPLVAAASLRDDSGAREDTVERKAATGADRKSRKRRRESDDVIIVDPVGTESPASTDGEPLVTAASLGDDVGAPRENIVERKATTGADRKPRKRRRESDDVIIVDPVGMEPPATTDGEPLVTAASLGDDVGAPREDTVEQKETTGADRKLRKRRRASDDVIIVDPDSDEEEPETTKKRRLSPVPAAEKDGFSPDNGKEGDRRNRSVEEDHKAQSQEPSNDPVDETKSDRTVVGTEGSERTTEKPSPRNVSGSVWTPERKDSPLVDTREKDAEESRETKATRERSANASASSAKKVTREVEKDPRPLSGYGALSIPDGVDFDPCPMALSEPSESSEYSSDGESNSAAGSVSDGRAEDGA